jgi:DNA excision repair protein ERCC-3
MTNPLIVQSDNTLLLEVNNPLFEEARDAISHFAELEKSPEHIHTYRISALSLWNAASTGMGQKGIMDALKRYSRYDIPEIVSVTIREQMGRYGILRLVREQDRLVLRSSDPLILSEIYSDKKVQPFIESRIDPVSLLVRGHFRGHIKQSLIRMGFPVEDLAGYDEGDPCPIELKERTPRDIPFIVRDYQESAIGAFYRGGALEGGSGVIVLPCGAGKTIVGIGVMNLLKTQPLILVTNTVALRLWREELRDKPPVDPDMIGEYSGERKDIRPITIATYNILTYRGEERRVCALQPVHVEELGLIIYDEVHLLPAPVSA